MGSEHPPPAVQRDRAISPDRSPALHPILRQRLRESAGPDGFLPFDRYMELALYEPGTGFYNRPATRLGRAGDFYTAAHVSRLFGATLAEHFEDVRRSEGSPDRFDIVEMGPGDGTLAEDIRRALPAAPEGSRWAYTLVERSLALRRQVEERLGSGIPGSVRWRFSPSLAAGGPIRGIVLANEFLDAFPCRRLQKTPGGWADLGVVVLSEGPVQTASRPVPPSLPSDLELPAVPEGTVLEVSTLAEAWIREAADHLSAGRLLLIDYGAEESELIRRGEAGTLEAVRAHERVDPLDAPGTADLSAWVNFSRVRNAARRGGLRETFYGPLSEAMVQWRIDRVRSRLEAALDPVEAVKLQLAQKSFLFGFPSFRVLELAPGSG